MTADAEQRSVDRRTDPSFFRLMTASYAGLLGRPLVPAEADPGWLYSEAPFVVVAHDAEPDPRFVYANRIAQACFEYPWDEFIQLPSRLSAEAPNREERQAALDAVAQDGFIRGYRGLRISKSGRRFWINDGVVWQLTDQNGRACGQAAAFASWTYV